MKFIFYIATVLVTAKLASSVLCPYPFVPVGSGCYYIPPQSQINWLYAFAICSLDLNGYLVEIDSQQEQSNIAAFIERMDPKKEYYYALGATDSEKDGKFRWMTSGNYLSYYNWKTGEPNNYGGSQQCICMHDSKWEDTTCEERTPHNLPIKALCEANPLNPCTHPTCSTTAAKSCEALE